MDLPERALVESRTGSSGQCEADPGCLVSDLKLNFGYVIEYINTHLLQNKTPHLVGYISGNVVVNLGQQCWSREQRATAAA
jgi:hypothetical protein